MLLSTNYRVAANMVESRSNNELERVTFFCNVELVEIGLLKKMSASIFYLLFKLFEMKNYIFSFLLLLTFSSHAQIKSVSLQASGLTCSMCSKAIYKSLSAISFIQSVDSDIKNSSFLISFKPNAVIDYDVISKAVVDAGFSVASLKSTIDFNNVSIKNDAHIEIGGKTYHFLNVQPQSLSGEKEIKLIDKKYVPTKEYKKYNGYTKMKCFETGYFENCCPKNEQKLGTRIYHATI
jgi:copper chaperone CopZ